MYKFECMDDHAMHCLVYLVLATIIEQSVSHFLIFNNFSLIFPDFLRLILTADQWERQHRDGSTGSAK